MAKLAEHYGVSRQTIYNWKDAGCPVNEGPEWIDAWLEENRNTEPEPGDLKEQLLKAQIGDVLEAQRKKRLANDEREGLTVSREDAEQALNIAFAVVRQRVEQLIVAAEIEIGGEKAAWIVQQLRLALKEAAMEVRKLDETEG